MPKQNYVLGIEFDDLRILIQLNCELGFAL
jgi:hypothetical protein